MKTIGSYAIEITTQRPFEDAIARVTATLAEQGFGVLTEIDVAATLQKKLGETMEPYLILGACNPKLAYGALGLDPGIGALLPCNVVVADEGDGVVVSAIDPRAMFAVVGNPALDPIVDDVRARLARVLAQV